MAAVKGSREAKVRGILVFVQPFNPF